MKAGGSACTLRAAHAAAEAFVIALQAFQPGGSVTPTALNTAWRGACRQSNAIRQPSGVSPEIRWRDQARARKSAANRLAFVLDVVRRTLRRLRLVVRGVNQQVVVLRRRQGTFQRSCLSVANSIGTSAARRAEALGSSCLRANC